MNGKDDVLVEFVEVQKSYDGETLVIKNFNLEISRGEFVTLLGPSGSGKTTCLMMLAGFEIATHGTIILDGRLIKSCTALAVQADGGVVETVEGLELAEQLHPLQVAFSEHHGLQCGYCTPGMLMAAKNLLDEIPNPTREQISKGIAGNVCRCTGYQNIIKAVSAAAKQTLED